MKQRLWILLALAAVALLASSTPVFRDSGSKAKTVAKVFDTIVQQRYPGWATAYSECVPSPQPNHDVCWAEVHHGARYQQVEIGIDTSTSSPFPSAATPHPAWTRKPLHVAYPAGRGVANSPAYDWKLLMQGRAAPGVDVLALDGDSTGYPTKLFTFHCTGVARRLTCTNVAGDALTFTPAAFG